MESILRETLEVLSEHGKSGEDIIWCGNEEFGYFTWKEFVELIRLNPYDDQDQDIPRDLLIVGSDFWLERHECEGGEWWQFNSQPKRPANHVKLCRLIGTVWDTLQKVQAENKEFDSALRKLLLIEPLNKFLSDELEENLFKAKTEIVRAIYTFQWHANKREEETALKKALALVYQSIPLREIKPEELKDIIDYQIKNIIRTFIHPGYIWVDDYRLEPIFWSVRKDYLKEEIERVRFSQQYARFNK
jgi:hypothetical protein